MWHRDVRIGRWQPIYPNGKLRTHRNQSYSGCLILTLGLARHPIPVILLARLAVDVSIQGKGVASALLKDALIRTAQAAETIGARALLVHAKDDEAKAFYRHFTFEPSPSDPYHLLLMMKGSSRS